MKLIFSGLRRSGTTIFWRTLRQDRQFLCLDEPFNPLWKDLPLDHEKGTHDEFMQLWHRSPEAFQLNYTPILPEEEISPTLTEEQKRYLIWLSSQSENTVIDTTRCYFKITDLHGLFPETLFIHLHRAPANWAYSHLVPSGPNSLLYKWLRFRRQRRLFQLRKGFNHWAMESVIKKCLTQDRGNAGNPSLDSAAVVKLLWFWHMIFQMVESTGQKLFRNNFLSVRYEDFCTEPANTMNKIYKLIGRETPKFDFSIIKPISINPINMQKFSNWQAAACSAGVPDTKEYLFRR